VIEKKSLVKVFRFYRKKKIPILLPLEAILEVVLRGGSLQPVPYLSYDNSMFDKKDSLALIVQLL
jgi:hypothetical protein